MKKVVASLVASITLVGLVGCGAGEKADNTLVVGASNVPHAEILEEAQPLLEKEGITLKIKKFDDYVLPNKALKDEQLDANYFQHIPYLESQMKDNEYKFVNAGGIHIEPIGVYSQKYKALSELPKGGKVIMSNSVADHGRMLLLLQKEGVLKLKEGIDQTKATIEDIVDNPKELTFVTNVNAEMLPQAYKNGEGDAVLINTNFAIDAGLNPKEDSIALEGSQSPYVNIITVREGDENKEEIKKLVEVLRSKEIQDFIIEKYDGAVVPVSE